MRIATPPAPKTDAIREKLAATRKELGEALIERDDEIDLVLTALIAREHLLLVGPPGCGKAASKNYSALSLLQYSWPQSGQDAEGRCFSWNCMCANVLIARRRVITRTRNFTGG